MPLAGILNNVIGPVMPGSSSSHTAGPYHIGRICRSMMGEVPASVSFVFEPGSSIAECYHDQGSDLALVMGILDLPLTDPRFKDALTLYPSFDVKVEFLKESFAESCHPNSIKINAVMKGGGRFSAVADSTGGGGLIFRYVDGWEVDITGDSYALMVTSENGAVYEILSPLGYVCARERDGVYFFLLKSPVPTEESVLQSLLGNPDVLSVRRALPVFFPICGEPIFSSGAEMISYALENGISLADAALEYESKLLCLPKDVLNAEMERRLAVMEASVKLGLSEESPGMLLLHPTARKIMDAERAGKLALGGIHTRAAARAMAAMQVNSGQGIVCAAPTGGSAGVLPGVLVTMLEDMNIPRETVVRSMWAAGAAGWVLAVRGTFAAEVCGCQVEIGAAGAMGAAAVVEAAGGDAAQACDAAAIMFQNAMGLVCDLVQTTVEIPCHTRNGSFASQAFICADMVLGGYVNPIPIDETVDAVYSTGQMLPHELRCTSLGGIAAAPCAVQLKKLR